jgi:hypothetical protein
MHCLMAGHHLCFQASPWHRLHLVGALLCFLRFLRLLPDPSVESPPLPLGSHLALFEQCILASALCVRATLCCARPERSLPALSRPECALQRAGLPILPERRRAEKIRTGEGTYRSSTFRTPPGPPGPSPEVGIYIQ